MDVEELAIMDYVKYYAGPLISMIGLAGFLLGGNWVWLGFATFPAITRGTRSCGHIRRLRLAAVH